jgi:hypothetical protein
LRLSISSLDASESLHSTYENIASPHILSKLFPPYILFLIAYPEN